MVDFKIHDLSTAPEASKPFLEASQKKFGAIPNLIGILADSPQAVDAYMALARLAGETSFSPIERTLVWMTINYDAKCHYCMAAHTAIAKGEKIPDDVVEATRTGSPQQDPRLEALRQFTLQVVHERGWVSDKDQQAFLDAGFSRQNILELVTIAAQKLISNYVNHLAKTPVDKPFQAFAWEAEGAKT
ncbi:MAG: carboxymuconolactone decarboxylase family protein [Planctomycetota bacterium]